MDDFAIVAKTRVIIVFGRSSGFVNSVNGDVILSEVECQWVIGIGDINGDGIVISSFRIISVALNLSSNIFADSL